MSRFKRLEKVQLCKSEVGEKAFQVYSNLTFEIYQNADGVYFGSANGFDQPEEIGSLEDVAAWLEGFAKKILNITFTFEIDYFAKLEQYYAPEDLPKDFDIEKAINGDEIYDVERYGKMKVGYTVQADDCWFSILTDGRPWGQETIFNNILSDLELVDIDDGFCEIVMPDGDILRQDDVYDIYWLRENKLLDIGWNFSD